MKKNYIKLLILIFFAVLSTFAKGQMGPGGIGTTDGSSDLKAWWRADQNVLYNNLKEISLWGDYSGNGNDFGNSTTAPLFLNAQLNNLPVINFNSDGSAGFEIGSLTGSTLFDNVSNTIFFVKKSTSGVSWMHWEPAAANQMDFSILASAATYTHDNTTNGTLAGAGDITSAFNFISSYTDGSNQFIYLNGDQDATQVYGSDLDNSVSANFYLGSKDGTATDGWIGKMAEVIVFNTNLNSAQRLIVENYLSSKYDLAFTTGTNDKYSGDTNGNGDFDFDVAGIGQESDGDNTLAASKGVYISEINNSLNDGDYVFIGHNNSVNSETTDDLTGGVTQRWSKSWYIDQTNSVDIKISFDLSEGIDGSTPKSPATDYVLLYRGINSGNFSEVSTISGMGVENTDRVYFEITSGNYSDGYYTIGTKDKINSPLSGSKIWYSYLTGDWDTWTSWTLDPDGSLLINGSQLIPGAADSVVILNGIDITISTNTKLASLFEVRSGGFLTINSGTSLHDFTIIKGEGKIKMADDNFPAGDYSDFAANGILEFYGAGFTYTGGVTYNELIVNMDNNADQVTMTGDITLYSDFTINKGTFQINDASTTALNFIIGGNLYIDANGTLQVGSGNTVGAAPTYAGLGTGSMQFYTSYHVLEVNGDFTNLGTVSLTNEGVPLYNALSTGGGVSLFMKGSTDNTMTLRGTTDLYNFVVDKGSGQNSLLTLYSSDFNNFALFGSNTASLGATGGSFSVTNPEIRKSMWIKNGTLELTGNVNIESLTEDNGYYIPENGRLLLNGTNITVNSTADAGTGTGINVSGAFDQSMYLYGTLQITDGTFNSNTSEGIVIGDGALGAYLKIESGNITASQFTCVNSTDDYAYYQSGGTFTLMGDLTGNQINTSDASFSVLGATNGYEVSGGTIEIYDGTATGKAFKVGSNASNYSVTGGTLKMVYDESDPGDNYIFNSTAPIYNLETELQNYTAGSFTLDLASDLLVLNDIIINDHTTLDVTASNYNVTIGGGMTIGNTTTTNNAVYNARTNTTTFNGSGNATINILNTNGINPLAFSKLIIDKESSSDEITLLSTGRTATDTLVKISSDFTVNKGIFNNATYYVQAKGDLLNYDKMGKAGSTGKIILKGNVTQNLYGNLTGTSFFGHIELDNTDGSGIGGSLNSDAIFEDFTLTQGIFYIDKYLMKVNSGVINGTGFGITKKIEGVGNPSDKGLSLYIAANTYTNGVSDFIYPIGVAGNYSYVDVDLNGTVAIGGYLAIASVDDYHPTTDPNKLADVIPYYWKVEPSSSLSPITGVTYTFDVPAGIGLGGGKKHIYLYNGSWTEINTPAADPLVFASNLYDADYSAGKKNALNAPRTLYSIGNGFFNTAGTWSETGHGGAATGTAPQSFDNVIIGSNGTDNHYVTVNTGNSIDVAMVTINSSTIPASSDPEGDEMPTLDIVSTAGHSFYSLSGSGKFKTSLGTNIPVTTDLVDFLNDSTAVFEYSGASYTLPSTINIYPNLRIGGDASSTKTLPATDILVQQKLQIYDESNTGVSLLVSSSNDIEVLDSLVLKNQSNLIFPSGAANTRTVTVNKSIDFTVDGTANSNSINVQSAASGNDNHKLIVYEDIILGASNITLWTAVGNRAVDLYMSGSENSTITLPSGGTNNLVLNDLYIDKDLVSDTVEIFSDFTLTDNTNKSLNINNGTLILDNSAIDVTLSSGDGDFIIPSTGRMILKNGAVNRILGPSSGLILGGKLELKSNSQFITDEYIEYTSSGLSEIVVSDSLVDVSTTTLTVGSQLRRNTSSTAGILKYKQTGGTVEIAKIMAPDGNRGVFEILNAGSEFTHTAGSLTIVRGQTSPTIASFYLDPETANISASNSIKFGNDDTPSGAEIGIYSSVSLHNIEIVNNVTPSDVTLKLWTDQLTLADITIASGTTLDADGYDLIISGDFDNSGTYHPGTNTTTFNGAVQTINGNAIITTFNNLAIQSTTSVTLQASTELVINGSLSLTNGELADGGNIINLKGNVTNTAIHSTLAPGNVGGIIFNGSVRQNINGVGTYGRLEIANSNGVNLNNDFSLINDEFKFTLGSLFIYNHSFSIGTTGNLTGNFNENTMIVTNGVTSDNGVIKQFPASAHNVLIPIGIPGKYTPIEFDVTNNIQLGEVTIIPIDQYHPTVTDPNNVLQYYWDVTSTGFQDLEMTAKFIYEEQDVVVDGTNLESDYLPAYLEDAAWAKFNSDNVNSSSNEITFSYDFSGASDISGVYTAGIDAAIPDNVLVYESVADTDWNLTSTWEVDGVEPDSPPNGQIVHVNTDVTISENLKSAYKTVINTGGKLTIGTTFGHYLGEVSGSGTLSLGFGKLPAGNYDSFFTCSGGIIEYGGSTNYVISDEGDTYRKMIFSGTGTRTLPDKDLVFCDTLLINGPTLDNQYNNDITLNGQIELQSGIFDSGIGSTATVLFTGSSQQEIKGNFTGVNAFNNFTVNNSAGISLAGNIEIDGTLTLTDGIISTNSNSTLLAAGSSVSPVGGSSSSFVDGALSVEIDNGQSYAFPIGKGTRYGKLELNSITSSGTQTWVAEYFEDDPDNAPYNTASHDLGGSGNISQTEYWELNGTGSGTVKVRWDAQSDVSGLSTTVADIRLMQWTPSTWGTVGTTYTGSGASGTMASDAVVTFSGSLIPFTLGSIGALLPTATIISVDESICENEAYDLIVAMTGTADWVLNYKINGIAQTQVTGIASSPVTFNSGALTAGTYVYTLTTIEDNAGIPSTAVSGSATVTVTAAPTVSVADPVAICEGANTTLNAVVAGGTGGYTYLWDNSTTLSDPSLVNPTAFPIINTTYQVTVTDANGCTATDPDGGGTVTVNAAPTPVPVPSATSICYGDFVTIDADVVADGYEWTYNPLGATLVENAAAQVVKYTPSANPSVISEDVVFTIKATYGTCVSAGAIVTITVNRTPETGNVFTNPNN